MQRFRHSQGDLGYLRVVRMLRLLRLVRLGRSWQKTVHPSLASNSFGHSDLSCMFITYSGGYSRLLCLQEYLGVPVKASTILVPSVATLPRSRLAWKVMKMSRNLWLLVQGFIAPWTCKVQISLGPIGNTAHCTYTVLSFFFLVWLCLLNWSSLAKTDAGQESFSTLCWVSFLILFVIYAF